MVEGGSSDSSLFESAFRDASIGMALVGLDGRWLRVNEAVCNMLGYSRQSLLEADSQGLTQPDDPPTEPSAHAALLRGEISSYHVEKRYLHADGRDVCVQLTVSLVRDREGAPAFFLAQLRDESERRRAEQQASLFFEASLDMMALVSSSGALERVNRAFERVLGWTLEDLASRPLLELAHPDDRRALEDELATSLAGLPSHGMRCRMRSKDGAYRWLEWNVRPIEGLRMLVLARDVSAQVEQERLLRLSQRALASINEGVLITDNESPDNPIVYCNPAFERISGYRQEELLGKSCRILQRDDRDQPELEVLRHAIRDARPCQVVLRNYRKDGELFLSCLRITPIFDALGKPSHFMGSVEDVTERVQMQDQIKRAALTDDLTGLYNRRGFMLLAEQQLRLAARHRQAVGLLFVDVDGMRGICEELGYDSGDDALIDVATILHRVLRSSDVVARLGDDEFVALIEGDADDVDVLRARLLETLSRHNQLANRAYRLGLSVGSSVSVPDRPMALTELLARAEEAMWSLKRRRRAASAN